MNSFCQIKNTDDADEDEDEDDSDDDDDEVLLVVVLCQLTNPVEDVVELSDGLQGSFVSLLQVQIVLLYY